MSPFSLKFIRIWIGLELKKKKIPVLFSLKPKSSELPLCNASLPEFSSTRLIFKQQNSKHSILITPTTNPSYFSCTSCLMIVCQIKLHREIIPNCNSHFFYRKIPLYILMIRAISFIHIYCRIPLFSVSWTFIILICISISTISSHACKALLNS